MQVATTPKETAQRGRFNVHFITLLVAGACIAAAGAGAAEAAKARVRLLGALRAAFASLMDGMLIGALPLPALLAQSGTGEKGAVHAAQTLLYETGKNMAERPETAFRTAFYATADRLSKGPLRALRQTDLQALAPWLGMIGEGGMDQQRRALEGAAAALNRLEQEAEKRLSDDVRLCRTLGLTAGAAVVLLFL